MTTPEQRGKRIYVALDALHADAVTWDRLRADLRVAGAAARELSLTALHVSMLADELGVTEKYTQVQDALVKFLDDGAAAAQDMTEALVRAADTYAREEAIGMHDMKRIW